MGLSDLAIGQYDQNSGEGVGFTGVGWENAEIYYTRYDKMNPIAIYDKNQKLDLSIFDGLILKILENITPNSSKISTCSKGRQS